MNKRTVMIINIITLLAPWVLYGAATAQMHSSTLCYLCGGGLTLIYIICALLNVCYKNLYNKVMLNAVCIGAFGTIFVIGVLSGYMVCMVDNLVNLLSYTY